VELDRNLGLGLDLELELALALEGDLVLGAGPGYDLVIREMPRQLVEHAPFLFFCKKCR